MRKTLLAIAMVALLAVGGQVFGANCTPDNVPAATLLIPYFQVDVSACDDYTTATTFFSVNNASDSPVVAHVTYWTDYSLPLLDFDIYLTGYDVQTMDVKDIFCTGNLPVTDPTGDIGEFSSATAGSIGDLWTFPSCYPTDTPPLYTNPAINDEFKAFLVGAFTGSDGTRGSVQDNGYAHGYITVDANRDCSLRFPNDDEYWNDAATTVNWELANMLWGDYQYLSIADNTSEGFTAVHVEAYAANVGVGSTFYGRYTDDGLGLPNWADGREPLPTTFGARYNLGAGFNGTWLNIWREGPAAGLPADIDALDGCDGLDQNSVGNNAVAFNEQEEVLIGGGGPSGAPAGEGACIPYETQSILVDSFVAGGPSLPTAWANGWYYLNLQNGAATAGSLGQAYMTVSQQLNVNGLFSGGWDAIVLDSSCAPITANPTAGGFLGGE